MGIVSRTLDQRDLYAPARTVSHEASRIAAGLARKYRLTLLFAITSIALIAAAAMLVNIVVGNLAENNLIRIAEENTARDGLHIQSMMRGGHSMDSDAPNGKMHSQTIDGMEQPMPGDMLSGQAAGSNKSHAEHESPNARLYAIRESDGF